MDETHTYAHTHSHTCTHSYLILKHQDRRYLTVVHEYAEHISTVLSKDRSSLKSSTYPVFFSLSFSPITSFCNSFYPCIYLSPILSCSPPLFTHSAWNGKSMHRSQLRVHTPFFFYSPSFLTLNLELPWQQEEQGWREKGAPFPWRGREAVVAVVEMLLDIG